MHGTNLVADETVAHALLRRSLPPPSYLHQIVSFLCRGDHIISVWRVNKPHLDGLALIVKGLRRGGGGGQRGGREGEEERGAGRGERGGAWRLCRSMEARTTRRKWWAQRARSSRRREGRRREAP
jgi:hypothetical protein